MDMIRTRVASCLLVCCLKHHASLLPSFLLENSLYFDVNEIISFQKFVENLDKMIVANLGRQHQISLDFYFENS